MVTAERVPAKSHPSGADQCEQLPEPGPHRDRRGGDVAIDRITRSQRSNRRADAAERYATRSPNPASSGADGKEPINSWASSPKIEELRTAWLATADLGEQKPLCRRRPTART